MNVEFDELCECDIETNNLNPALDPLTIIVNIISRDERDLWEIDIDIFVNSDIINNSSLRSIGIIFFRHQHILAILVMIIIFIILLIFRIFYIQSRYFIKLFRTFVNIIVIYSYFFCKKYAACSYGEKINYNYVIIFLFCL